MATTVKGLRWNPTKVVMQRDKLGCLCVFNSTRSYVVLRIQSWQRCCPAVTVQAQILICVRHVVHLLQFHRFLKEPEEEWWRRQRGFVIRMRCCHVPVAWCSTARPLTRLSGASSGLWAFVLSGKHLLTGNAEWSSSGLVCVRRRNSKEKKCWRLKSISFFFQKGLKCDCN